MKKPSYETAVIKGEISLNRTTIDFFKNILRKMKKGAKEELTDYENFVFSLNALECMKMQIKKLERETKKLEKKVI